jgi:hypothetical protein
LTVRPFAIRPAITTELNFIDHFANNMSHEPVPIETNVEATVLLVADVYTIGRIGPLQRHRATLIQRTV